MHPAFPYFLFFAVLLDPIFTCVHTSNSGNPTTGVTTTLAPGVTTTTVTTTTTTQTACTTCMAGDINFIKGDPAQPGTFDSTFQLLDPDPATGCSRLMAICAGDAGMVSFMQFNINQGGPIENQDMTQVVMAPLECVNGQWLYMNQRVVTAVDCSQAPMG